MTKLTNKQIESMGLVDLGRDPEGKLVAVEADNPEVDIDGMSMTLIELREYLKKQGLIK